MSHHSEFLVPHSTYHGSETPEHQQFNANLQTFSQQVNFICALENNGKLSPRQAYDKIQELWQGLDTSGQQLSKL